MSKPSILLINRVYPPVRGATGRLLQDMANALEQSGWKVTILATDTEPSFEAQANISIKRIKSAEKYKTAFGYILNWCRLLVTALKMPKHDVVLTLSDPPMLYVIGGFVSQFKGSAHVHWCQDLYPDLFRALGVKLPQPLIKILMKII